MEGLSGVPAASTPTPTPWLLGPAGAGAGPGVGPEGPGGFPHNLSTDALHELANEITEELNARELVTADIWVGVVLTLMILSCVCCVCSCFIYHKFQQWKHAVLEGRVADLEAGTVAALDEAPLPSYTLVSGLPTYDEALDQLQTMRQLRRTSSANKAFEAALAAASAAGNRAAVAKLQFKRLSVGEILHLYRSPSIDKG